LSQSGLGLAADFALGSLTASIGFRIATELLGLCDTRCVRELTFMHLSKVLKKASILESVRNRIAAIREQKDTTKRIKMLQELNESLPAEKRLEFPSLITNAYIRTALDKIESTKSA
jgi:hypothetical protein